MILGSARPRVRLLSAAAGSVLVLALAACSGGTSGGPAAQPSATSPSESPTPSPTPTQVQRSLLSGRAGAKDGPVLAVKLDNTSFANPHSGLKQADVVYVEEVEGGLTRYAAIYSSEIPTAIGPIRSARITDIDLLAQYGKVAFAYSGAQTKLRPVIAGANLYDVSGDRGAFGYWRQSGRQAPYDFFGNGQKLLARAPQAAVARDVGFRFATDVPAGGQPVTRVVANYPSARMAFSWDAASRALAGRPGRHPGPGHRGRRARWHHGDHPVRPGGAVDLPRPLERQHADVADHRLRPGPRAARRPGVQRDLVPAERRAPARTTRRPGRTSRWRRARCGWRWSRAPGPRR